MAVKSTFIGNTAWVGELEVTDRKDSAGNPYQAKSILFRVATKREYNVTKEVNGKQIKERPTDFISCKATGHVAQLIKDYASSRKADGGIVSRVVELSGHFETYKVKKEEKKIIERTEKRQIKVGGQIYEFDLPISVEAVHEYEYWQTMFIVDSINFWDSSNESPAVTSTAKPTPTVDTTAVLEATPVSATPVSADVLVDEAVVVEPAKAEVITEEVKPAEVLEEEIIAPKTETSAPKVSENEINIVIPADALESSPF